MRTVAAAARELKKERATWDCWCVFFSLSFVVVKNAHPVKYNLLTAANVFCGPGRVFFFLPASAPLLTENACFPLLEFPPTSIVFSQMIFLRQLCRLPLVYKTLGGKWQAGTGSDDKWHGPAGLALSAHIQPFPSRFLFIRAAPLAPKATQLKIKRGVGSEWICGDNTPQNVIRHPIKYYVNIQSQPKYWKHTSGKEKLI